MKSLFSLPEAENNKGKVEDVKVNSDIWVVFENVIFWYIDSGNEALSQAAFMILSPTNQIYMILSPIDWFDLVD